MKKVTEKTFKWIGLVTGAGLAAISALFLFSTSASPLMPADVTSEQFGHQRQQEIDQRRGREEQYQVSGRYDWATYQPGHRPALWQQYRLDFNPRRYEINRNAERSFHWQHYAQPQSWHYQRWVYGQILPVMFWGREYWLTNYSEFGLVDPPYGYVWVRYGDDGILVGVEGGNILSVVYGEFS
jgi:Ni/Co efflux regulator RcnB